MDTEDKSDGITAKRCLIAGIWTWIVILVTVGMEPDGLVALLVIVPLVGLPWLLFTLNDREREKRTIDAWESIGTIFCGAFISLLCAVPLMFVVLIVRSLFR